MFRHLFSWPWFNISWSRMCNYVTRKNKSDKFVGYTLKSRREDWKCNESIGLWYTTYISCWYQHATVFNSLWGFWGIGCCWCCCVGMEPICGDGDIWPCESCLRNLIPLVTAAMSIAVSCWDDVGGSAFFWLAERQEMTNKVALVNESGNYKLSIIY